MKRVHIGFLWAALLSLPLAGCAFDSSTGNASSTVEDPYDDDGGVPDDCGCTLTQGYWKNHEDAWPVDSLELGNHTYDQEQLLSILREPVRGNGLLSMGHQLIAAKLNVAAGASDGDIADAIAEADAVIGDLVVPPVGDDSVSTSSVSGLVGALDGYNNGVTGPGHCDDGPTHCEPEPYCGDGNLDEGEDCDDGNNEDGDGCSANCTVEEPEPYCGDGNLDDGEECDDGNNEDGDGCSANCTVERDGYCGDGYLDEGEQCDDGNNVPDDGCDSYCYVEIG